MTWTFLWLMLLLKIPIGGLLWIVWWAIHKTDEEPAAPRTRTAAEGDARRAACTRARRGPSRPRRGPHAGAPPPAPRRTRSVVARARKVEH